MKSRRKALLAVSGVTFLLVLLFFLIGYERTWLLWNIPVTSPPFADLRVITHGGDSVARGLDPLISNPGDPWGRPLNYPRIWQSLYSVGVNKSHTALLGLGIILSFLAGVVMILPTASNMTASLVVGALLSPAVLLGIERANIDLFIFFLVALSIALARKSLALADGIIILATALKLFPIFGVTLLLRCSKKRFVGHAIVVLAIACAYLIANLSDLRLISHATPRGTDLSYGMNIAWMRLEHINSTLGMMPRFICSAFVAVAAFLFFAGCTYPYALKSPNEGDDSFDLDSFRVGSSIYLGTFILGNNWDYRLIFLILCIPQLSSWITSANQRLKWCSRAALCTILVSMWYLVIGRVWGILASTLFQWIPSARLYPWLLDELSNWLLFLLLTYLFSIALPQWVKNIILYPFRPTRRST